jgi:nucleoside-diphosphate-sugar epimerase
VREADLDWNRDPHPAHFGVGWGMRSLEKLCDFWHRQGMELLIARAANVYGPWARFDPATSNFLPALIRKAVAGMDPFEVWGSPQVTRDLLFAGDLADAVAAMLAAEGVAFDTFNLGSGAGVQVGEAVEMALAAAGHRPSRVNWLSDRPVTVKSRVLDCTHAREALGWTPRTPLARGIEITTAWWRENKERWTR